VSSFLVYIGVWVALVSPDLECRAIPSFVSFCFMIIFGSLFAKPGKSSSFLFFFSILLFHQLISPFPSSFFVIVSFASLFVFRRIHKIFNSPSLKLVSLKNSDLFAIVGTLLIFELVIQGAWMGTDAPTATLIPSGLPFLLIVPSFLLLL
jgi:hypothetical protein